MSYSEDLLKKVKSRLLISYPFFGSAVSDYTFTPSGNVIRLYATGSSLIYNEAFIESASNGEIAYWLCREILHLTMDHGNRKKWRSPILWALATEYCINGILTGEGLSKWVQLRFYRRDLEGRSAEEIYSVLVDEERESGRLGLIEQMDELVREKALEQDTDIHVPVLPGMTGNKAAWLDELIGESVKRSRDYGLYRPKLLEMVSKARLAERTMGKSPVSVDLPVEARNVGSLNWEEMLQNYVLNDRTELSYRRFQRKYLPNNIYLPQRHHLHTDVVVVLDVSASISDQILDAFFSELLYLAQSRNRDTRMRLIQADAAIHSDQTVGPFTSMEDVMRRRGFGGTDFTCVFTLMNREHNTSPLIIFTDGRGIYPDDSPLDYDVIWVTTDLHMPWGVNLDYEVDD